jgi:serine protease
VTPTADASDTGDYISPADSTNTASFFYGLATSNSSWHGTHVSGIIAAIANNTIGVVGGAYSAKILPVRVLGKGGGYISDITEGIRWAANDTTVTSTYPNPNPAKVINLSLGGTGACSQTEQDAINAAVNAGAVVVVAAGNGVAGPSGYVGVDVATASPANCNNVITVAAIGKDGRRAVYSNFSSPTSNSTNPTKVTLAAQGGDPSLTTDLGIYSTINGGTTTPNTTYSYDYKSGTSMATPHVVAAAALVRARNPTLTPAQVKIILAESTTAFPAFSSAAWAAFDCATLKNCGAGILNAQLAVQNSVSPLTASTTELDFGTLSVSSNNINPISMTVTLLNSSGATVTLGTAKITGVDASVFSITSDTCSSANIVSGSNCQVTLSFLPDAVKTYVAGLFIPAQPATAGTVVVGLSGKAIISLSAATALAATKSGSGGGGCSIMPAYSIQDNSLLLVLLLVIVYRYRQRLIFSLVKN